MTRGMVILGIAAAYLVVLVAIGEYARRRTAETREDYFMASRSFKALALFFSVVATVISAFGVMGIPGQVYRSGVAAFAVIAPPDLMPLPLFFATVGYRFWLAGTRFGHITPGQLLDHRYEASRLGVLAMALFLFWTIPYLVLGTIGGGIAFEAMTNGLVPFAAGAALVVLTVFLYVISGGMRGTTYTNVLQGAVMFVTLLGLAIYVAIRAGGPAAATAATLAQDASLGIRPLTGGFTTAMWFSTALLIPMASLMFPHVFLRILTGRDRESYRRIMVLVPTGMFTLVAISSLIGFWGVGVIPGLAGAEADQIVPLLAGQAPAVLAGFGLVLLLAAAMSSFDAQALTVTTLLSEDLLRPWTSIPEEREVRAARIGLGVLLAIVYGVALVRPGTIFFLAEFAFQGYSLLFYPVVVGLYWTGATRTGVAAGLVTGFLGIWLFQLGILPSSLTFGFLPFIPVLVVQIPVVHLVSWATETPSRDRIETYLDTFTGAW